ncbi:hypothetical protein [Massilia sp. DWR3-1-1]|uniref:hypothetical protein n=1 Tax=Massilia sp. DWR3-1-1 TaxID=2804559 RepID=UPI003CF9DF61
MKMPRIPRVAYSVTSQGLVSACNFLLCLALLYFAEPRYYVAFLLFLSVVQLLTGLQNALFISPVGVLVPRMQAAEVARTEKAAYRLAGLVALAGLPFIAYFFTEPPRLDGAAIALITAVFLSTILLLQREIARNACLVRADLPMLVKYDALYFLLAMALAGVAVALHALTFVVAVLAFALPACLTRFSRPQWAPSRAVVADAALPAFAPQFWDEVRQVVRWSVPGVVVTWLYSSGFWFILEHTQDTGTVASMGAARLLFAPVGLLIQGWLMQLRPLSVAMASAGRAGELRRTVLRHSCLGALCVGLITAAGWVLLTWFPEWLPRSMRSAGVIDYVIVWGIYFAVFWFRSGISTLLLARVAGFKTVFFANLLVCIAFYAMFFVSLNRVPLPLSLSGLIVAELLMLYLLSKYLHD